MAIGSGAELQQATTVSDRFKREVDVPGNVAGFDEGVEGGKERKADGLELGVGIGEGRLEGIDVGEERSEVVHGEDEVLVVGLADLLDFRLLGAGEVAEVLEQRLGLPGSKGLSDEWAHILAVADGGGEEQLIEFFSRVAVFRSGRSHFPPRFRVLHRGDVRE
ncbi:hypothetical protein ACFX1X_031746 [Malus domestica]